MQEQLASAYATSHAAIIKLLESDSSRGLTNKEAAKRLQEFGPNMLKAKRQRSLLEKFVAQFKNIMIIILLIAAGISFAVALIEGHGLFEPILIVAIVVLNAIIGVIQENKAEKALEALKHLASPKARIVRGGTESRVDARDLVVGDIVKIEAGDFVPADIRLIETASLKVEESALTGESEPDEKDAQAEITLNTSLGDRITMVYSGCSVVYGHGRGVVVGTGMDTEIGKIASLLEEQDGSHQTPLQHKLAELGMQLGILALIACAIIFVIGLMNNMPILEIFMIAVSLAVSAIPEGLPAIVTVVLAIGVQRMAKKNAIVRKLPAVETLGSASVICSDKTGTLTQNRMTLTAVYLGKNNIVIELGDKTSSAELDQLLTYGVLCSDGNITINADGKINHLGDPTETAIVYAAHQQNIIKSVADTKYPRLMEIPFDSDRKLMTTVHNIDGKIVVITKGAFDSLKHRCASGPINDGATAVEDLSKQALRVLAIAYKEIPALPDQPTSDQLESDLTFVGLFGMIDPPRVEAAQAVAVSRAAGIKPVMITGDHIVTATAIARQLDIIRDGEEAVSGADIDTMSDKGLTQRIEHISVYARVSPENKIRIVKAWQSKGHIVAMTGDGVNDAPALHAADIGCAMGITGTDVSKGASDMILTDDNFATIIVAVREGRGIYENIKKVVGFLLGTNIGEVVAVLGAMAIWQQTPFLAIHLLWINLITDSLPAIALGMEPVEDDVMKHKPKPKSEGIFAHGYGLAIILMGMMFGILALIAFTIGWRVIGSIEAGRTMAFATIALSQSFHAYNMRSSRSLLAIGLFSNKYINGAALLSLLATCGVLFIDPVAQIFSLTTLPLYGYLTIIGLAFLPIVIMEFSKYIKTFLKK